MYRGTFGADATPAAIKVINYAEGDVQEEEYISSEIAVHERLSSHPAAKDLFVDFYGAYQSTLLQNTHSDSMNTW